MDVKRELGKGEPANKELAADLASFAVDGGRLIIGVDEANNFALTPTPLPGLAERIESVARSRIEEPLVVEFSTIRTDADPNRGYLVVTVPMSPRAPHMVGNRYWYRGDKTKYPLSDPEVERLIDLRKRWEPEAEALLDAWIARDPIAAPEQTNAHLFVVCAPVPRVDDALLPLLQVESWQAALHELVRRVERPDKTLSPDISQALQHLTRRPNGWGARSRERPPAEERNLVELEITEDGLLQLMHLGAGARLPESGLVVYESACLAMVHEMVSLATIVGQEIRFLGNWDIGVAITGLRGSRSYLRAVKYMGGTVYNEFSYRKVVRATRPEMQTKPAIAVAKLMARFTRALGVDGAPEILALLGQTSDKRP